MPPSRGAELGVDDAGLVEGAVAGDAASARQAFTKGGEVAAEISTPSVCRPASFSMLGRDAAITIGMLRAAIGQPAAGDLEDLALEVDHLAGEQRAADLHRLADRHQRLGRLDARGLEVGRRAGAEAEDDAAGIHLVEARRRHGDVHRMRRVGAHRHQGDLDAPGGAERQRRHGDGIAQDRDGRRSTGSRRRPPPPPAPAPGCRRSARGRRWRCRTQPWEKP